MDALLHYATIYYCVQSKYYCRNMQPIYAIHDNKNSLPIWSKNVYDHFAGVLANIEITYVQGF